MYLKEVINNGGLLTTAVAIDTARGLLLAENRNKLAEFGGHIDLNRHRPIPSIKGWDLCRKSTTA